jgi:hypothetical protein
VADEVTPGELDRRLRDHEARTDRVHAELDNRIAENARAMVPLAVYQTAERARDAEIARIEQERSAAERRTGDRLTALEARPGMTAARWLGVITVALAFVALLVEAYGTLRGVK